MAICYLYMYELGKCVPNTTVHLYVTYKKYTDDTRLRLIWDGIKNELDDSPKVSTGFPVGLCMHIPIDGRNQV